MNKAKQLLAALACALVGQAAHAMTFEERCMGNAVESCFLIAEGEITAETPALFTQSAPGSEARKILFDSPGGNLGAGIRLGRLIRENGFETFIGTRASFEAQDYPPSGGQCLSACAYAFAGGVMRNLGATGQLGFHQFRLGAKADVSAEQLTEAIEGAQAISAQVISYLVEMGVDARVFALASGKTGTDMHMITQQEALEFDLVAPRGFGSFFLEPYGNGVVAASKRVDRTGPYDLVTQMTAYCKKGKPKLLFHAPEHGLYDQGARQFYLEVDGRAEVVAESAVSIRQSDSGAYLEVTLPAPVARLMEQGATLGTGFDFPRSAGGSYGTYLTLSEMDRQMLKAAFRLCL
jgi:hypothetical protein